MLALQRFSSWGVALSAHSLHATHQVMSFSSEGSGFASDLETMPDGEDDTSGHGFSRSEGSGLASDLETTPADAEMPETEPDIDWNDPALQVLRLRPSLELRYTGDDTTKLVAAVLLEGGVQPYGPARRRVRDALDRTFGLCFGAMPRAVVPLKTEAKQLGTTSQHLRDKLCALATALHAAVRLYWTSMLLWICRVLRSPAVKGICYFQSHMQDETPIQLRAKQQVVVEHADSDVLSVAEAQQM